MASVRDSAEDSRSVTDWVSPTGWAMVPRKDWGTGMGCPTGSVTALDLDCPMAKAMDLQMGWAMASPKARGSASRSATAMD